MCKNKKFDRELKDKVVIIVTSLVKNHTSLQDLLQQKGRLSNDLENMVRSTLKTFQGLTIGAINMRDRTMQPSKNVNGQTPKLTRPSRIHQRWMIAEGRMERCLGKISRKTRPLSRNLLMIRKVHPEQTWYSSVPGHKNHDFWPSQRVSKLFAPSSLTLLLLY